jgi:hypothetical protein
MKSGSIQVSGKGKRTLAVELPMDSVAAVKLDHKSQVHG